MCAWPAWADDAERAGAPKAPPPNAVVFSKYEEESLRRGLAEIKGVVEPEPDGKVVEKIEIVRFEVLEDRDIPYDAVAGAIPRRAFGQRLELVTGETELDTAMAAGLRVGKDLGNAIHYTTRDFIVRREMLFREGDLYRTQAVQETARNIRAIPQIAQVVYTAVKGSRPGTVKLLFVTKDLWSLRLSYDLRASAGGVESFLLTPQETNLLGLHHVAQTRFYYLPESYTFGAAYKVPRFGLTRVGASATSNVVVNRRSGNLEGSAGSVGVGQGLFASSATWAWATSVGWTNVISRRYSNARLAVFDAASTPEREAIPIQYRSRSAAATAAVTRSFGWAYKNDLTLGFDLSTQSISTFDLSALDLRAQAEFVRRNIPVAEDRVGPSLTWRSYETRFHSITDVLTYALQEDYRLGHVLTASVYPLLTAIGSARNVLGGSVGGQYTLPMGDGLARASVETGAEYQLGTDKPASRANDDTVTDASVVGSLKLVSPKTPAGRVVMDITASNRYRNYLNRQSSLGGEDRLRGYPSSFYAGKDLIVYNLELRSRPIRLLSMQVGAVAFYDVGDAMNGFEAARAKQSTGIGLRTLIPWLNRVVFRVDLGVPLNRRQSACPTAGVPCKIAPVNFFVAFEQAFGVGGI